MSKPKEKKNLIDWSNSKKRYDYIDFQALFCKPNPSIKATEQMKITYLFEPTQNKPLPLSNFEFNSPELNGESINTLKKESNSS